MTPPCRPTPTRRPRPLGRRWHGFPRSHGPPERKVKAQWLRLRCCTDRVRATLRRPVPARPSERGRNAEQTRAPQESGEAMTCSAPTRSSIRASPRHGHRCRADPCRPKNRRNPRAAGMLENSEIWGGERTCRLRRKGCSVDRRRRPNAAPPRRKNASEKTEGTQERRGILEKRPRHGDSQPSTDARRRPMLAGGRRAIADACASYVLAFHRVGLETIEAQRIALCTRAWAAGPLRFSTWPGTTCGCPPATVAT